MKQACTFRLCLIFAGFLECFEVAAGLLQAAKDGTLRRWQACFLELSMSYFLQGWNFINESMR